MNATGIRAPTLIQGEAFGFEFLNGGPGLAWEQKHVPVLVPHGDNSSRSSTGGEVSSRLYGNKTQKHPS